MIIVALLLFGLERKLQISNQCVPCESNRNSKNWKVRWSKRTNFGKKTFYTSLSTKIAIEEVWRGHFCHNIRFQKMLQLSISKRVRWCIFQGCLNKKLSAFQNMLFSRSSIHEQYNIYRDVIKTKWNWQDDSVPNFVNNLILLKGCIFPSQCVL